MADKILINSGAAVVINTEVGLLTLEGHNAITKITDEQLKALKKRKDFLEWVEKGYITVDVKLNNVNKIKAAANEADINKQNEEAAEIRLEALTDAIMTNEGITDREAATKEARKRLSEEADKAAQAGDKDAKELKAASKAKNK